MEKINEFFRGIFTKLGGFWQGLSNSKKLLLAGVATVILAAIFFLAMTGNTQEMGYIYPNLSEADNGLVDISELILNE